jgi:hypothetical protein
MSGKGKLRLKKKAYFLITLLAAFMLTPAALFAQDLPCGGDDPYGNCPLDTNVWILAGIAIICGAVFLYKQQKMQRNKA